VRRSPFLSSLLAVLLTILLLTPSSLAEESEKTEKEEKKTSLGKALLQDEAALWTSPFRIRTKDLLFWVPVTALTLYSIKEDESIYRRFKSYQKKHSWVDDVSPKVTLLGDGGVNLAITSLFFLEGEIFHDPKAKETASLALQTLVHTAFVVQVGKHIAGRQRPSYAGGEDHWYGPSGFFQRYKKNGQFSKYDSFPSGHMITAMGLATVIAEQYKGTVWVPVTAYSLATLCGLSRVTEDAHWFSDVVAGAALGWTIARFVVRRRASRFQVSPVLQPGGGGALAINYAF